MALWDRENEEGFNSSMNQTRVISAGLGAINIWVIQLHQIPRSDKRSAARSLTVAHVGRRFFSSYELVSPSLYFRNVARLPRPRDEGESLVCEGKHATLVLC